MLKTSTAYKLILLFLLILLVFSLTACNPVEQYDGPIYGINDDESNQINKDRTEKGDAISLVTSSITNLKNKLSSAEVSEGGYYLGFDFHINTATNSDFVLRLQAHLFTWPYMNEYGVVREDDLKKHNEIIKKSTILIEWYDGVTNSMLIGFYFDGVKSNPNDPGNILYLNLQGEKRWFADFGDTVLFQQMIRLLTNFSLDDVLASAGAGEDGGVSSLETLLNLAITTNYKVVLNPNEKTNKDVTSVLFTGVSLEVIDNTLTEFIQKLFGPFEKKVDPLTNKYLGFRFSTLGATTIRRLFTDLQFFIEPDTDGVENILTGAYASASGNANVYGVNIPFTAKINIYYGATPPKPIELDKEFYKFYDKGKYEFVGELYLPTMDLRLDALIRTKVNDYDNIINHVFAEFRDIADGKLIIGSYYKNELIYIDVEGLQHLYGGIKIEDIGFPKVYIENFNLAEMLFKFNEMVDDTIVGIVDKLLDPDQADKNNMLEVILRKMAATEADPNDPMSKNTEMIRIDHELIKDVLREGGYGTYTTRDIINIINAQLPITLDELATILGITSAEILLEKTWIRLTLDVDTNQITLQLYSDIGIMDDNEPSKMLMQLDLIPVKIGEDMAIAEINFDDFNELLPVYTYSADMGGQFLFSNAEQVDLSDLLSAFMDDISGLNTPYILPMETKLDFTLVYDQYIREQQLQRHPDGERDGRWTQASRNAFILNVFIKGTTPEDNVTLFNIYANDVSFKSDTPVSELGYIWVDLVCIRNNPNLQSIPKFKIREDYWLQAVNRYLNASDAKDNVSGMMNPDISLSITTIISALVEDSYVVFQPEQIEITTSNETVQNIFGVKSLIGNIHTQVGLVQRVFGLDAIEDEFAHYSVAQFEDIVGYSPYTTKLHDHIDVIFNFNQNGRTWNELVPMKFQYEEKSIKIDSEPRSIYYPRIDGPIMLTEYESDKIYRFMGVERSYRITFTAGSMHLIALDALANQDWYDPSEALLESDRIITKEEIDAYSEIDRDYFESIKHRLLPHYRLEPMLPKPSQIEVFAGANIFTHDANILIDWSKVTTAGGEFFTQVIIAEGMMGEMIFPAHFVVTNRVVETSGKNPSVVNVTADAESDELTEAPVVDIVKIDPYDYLWAKAVYFKDNYREPIGGTAEEIKAALFLADINFVIYYMRQFNIAVRFVDFDPHVTDYRDTPTYYDAEQPYNERLEWYFDKHQPSKYYKETDITLTGGTTYLHANFLGQIVALQLNIESRTIRGVNFGEEEDNVYTADMLNPQTYDIPQYPLIIFEERDDADRYITKKLVDDANNLRVPMLWSNPRVDDPDINGTDTPFLGSTSNMTSSFVNLYRALGVGEWIFKDYSPIVVIKVDCPSKQLADLDIEPIMGYESLAFWNYNVATPINPSYVQVGDFENLEDYGPPGFYYVDPFRAETLRIPTSVLVTFKGRLDTDPTYTSKYHNLQWDLSSGLVEYRNGHYYLVQSAETETYLKLTTRIGDESVGTREITLCVKILTSSYSQITFYDDDGNSMSEVIEELTLGSYRYNVDTYIGFKLPHYFEALFGTSDMRVYQTQWKGLVNSEYVDIEDIKFEPGRQIQLRTTLPGANLQTLSVNLELVIRGTVLENIIFTNIPMIEDSDGTLKQLPINLKLNEGTLTIDGIPLNIRGQIENLYFGKGFYNDYLYDFSGVNVNVIEGVKDEWGNYTQQPVEAADLYPQEFLQLLFANTCLVFNYENEEKLVRDYQIHNLQGVMNMRDIIQRAGDTGVFGYGDGKYIIRLGQGAGAKDLEIRIRFTDGLYPLRENEEILKIKLYQEDGAPYWDETGFVLGDNVDARVDVSVQIEGPAYGSLKSFYYGKDEDERMDLWYVEYSNVALLPTGSYIYSIPMEILYDYDITNDMQLKLSYLTKEGFKIIRNIDVVEVYFGRQYSSVPTSGALFEIEDGTIEIKDLYRFYPLEMYLLGTDFLPKVIQHKAEDDYVITLKDINWVISNNWRAFLNNYDYQGNSVEILFATTTILGWYITINEFGYDERIYYNQETIELYIKVDSAEVKSLALEHSHGLETDYEDITVTASSSDEIGRERINELFGVSLSSNGIYHYREFIINVDAYKNSNYQGKFIPPANLVVKYANGVEHEFSRLIYTYRGVEISTINYDITGIIYSTDSNGNYIMISTSIGEEKVYLMRGDNGYNLTLSVDLGAGQVIAVKIHFYNKTAVATRPILEYSDEEVKTHIAEELAQTMEKLMINLQNGVNIAKLQYEINLAYQKNVQINEDLDINTVLSILKNITKNDLSIPIGSDLEIEPAKEIIEAALLGQLPILFVNPGTAEIDKHNYNYAAKFVIETNNEMLAEAVNNIFNLISDYLNGRHNISFIDVETYVIEFFENRYIQSARLVIYNKILDFIMPRLMNEINQMPASSRVYVAKLKNEIESKVDIYSIMANISKVSGTSSHLVDAIKSIIRLEIERTLELVIGQSSDSETLKVIIRNLINDRLADMDNGSDIIIENLIVNLASLYINNMLGTREIIEEIIDTLFKMDAVEYADRVLEMAIVTIEQAVEKASYILVGEMRASIEAGLSVNMGGRLERAVNLSIAAVIDNVILESKIIDAIRRTVYLNQGNIDNGQYTIDPYADYIYVPTRTEIIFSEINGGRSHIVNINWDKPAHWSTPRNPNAGVNYMGNETPIEVAKNRAWSLMFDELVALKQRENEEDEFFLTLEQSLLYQHMTDIINNIYGSETLSNSEMASRWNDLLADPGEDISYLYLIESRIEASNPDEKEEVFKALCFKMWANIKAWEQLKDVIVSGENQAIWEKIREQLKRRELALQRDEFTSTLYSEGITSQSLSLIIFVQNRRLESYMWNLYDEKEIIYDENDPKYNVIDPFAGKVSDFPSLIRLSYDLGLDDALIPFSDLNIVWEYTDQAISYNGILNRNTSTGKIGLIISGYMKNNRVGQRVSLRLIINSWEYNDISGSGIRQYNGNGDINDESSYTIMNPISFVFSKLVNYSAQDQYQIMIKETKYIDDDGIDKTEVVYRNVFFYPEDSRLIQDSVDDEQMMEIMRRRNYILYWDNEARNTAFNDGGAVLGNFSLGNTHKNRLTKSNSAYYQYEDSYISKVNATDYTVESLQQWILDNYAVTNQEALEMAQAQIEELYETNGVSMVIINPLDPKLPAQVHAIGMLNQIPHNNLGKIRVFWNKSYSNAVLDMTDFVRYAYPELTNQEAQKSALEILINTSRSRVQEQELINKLTEWIKHNWEIENQDQFSEMDYENWDIYYNKDSTSNSDKNKMNNIMNSLFLNNGSRDSDAEKSEGWKRMFFFLIERDSIITLTLNDKANAWDSILSFADVGTIATLEQMQQRIALDESLNAKEVKALCYDNHIKWSRWISLKSRYSIPDLSRVKAEVDNLQDRIRAANLGLTDYEIYAICWDIYAEQFEREQSSLLELYLTRAENQSGYGASEIAINSLAWDKWIKAAAFREWMTRLAKDMLMIEEIYDTQISPHYLGGGIDGAKDVTLLLQLTEGGYIYSQTFKIRVVFLDLSPLAYYQDSELINSISRENPPEQLTVAIKTSYTTDDYNGRFNPYGTKKEMVFKMLDYYAKQVFIKPEDSGDEYLLTITDIVWNIPQSSTSGSIVRSSSFTINGKTYNSSLLQMVLQ